MAIITKEINGRKYLYEVIAYRDNGKVKHKWTSLGRINDNNDLIISKKNRRKAFADAPGELVLKKKNISSDLQNVTNMVNKSKDFFFFCFADISVFNDEDFIFQTFDFFIAFTLRKSI